MSNITLTRTHLFSELVAQDRAFIMISFETWTGKSYKCLQVLQTIDSLYYILKKGSHKEKSKFTACSNKMILLGYYGGNIYRLWDSIDKEVIISSSVEFNENATLARLIDSAQDDQNTSQVFSILIKKQTEMTALFVQILNKDTQIFDTNLQSEVPSVENPSKNTSLLSTQAVAGYKRGCKLLKSTENSDNSSSTPPKKCGCSLSSKNKLQNSAKSNENPQKLISNLMMFIATAVLLNVEFCSYKGFKTFISRVKAKDPLSINGTFVPQTYKQAIHSI